MKNRFLHTAYQCYKPIRKFLDRVPFIGQFLVKLSRVFRDIVLSLYVFLSQFEWFTSRRIKEDVLITSFKVNPKDLIYKSTLLIDSGSIPNQVMGGSWDKRTEPCNFGELIKDIRQFMQYGNDFQQSSFYQKEAEKIDLGETPWGCQNHQQLEDICNQILKISVIFQEKGEIEEDQFSRLDGGLMIDIDRFGRLLFVQGSLTLAVAIILGLSLIPAKVRIRHSCWVKLRRRYEFLVTGTASRAYQPSLHPDLAYIPAQQNCVERFNLLKGNLSQTGGRLLELGSNIGYFSILLENLGFTCTAVENSPIFLFCLRTQKKALEKNLKIIPTSFLSSKEIVDQQYDIVLALNIFHHFLRRKDDFENLEKFLEHLNCKELYFEPHVHEDPQLRHAYVNMHEEEFVEFVRSKTKLTRSVLIGRASDKRPVYKLF